MTPLSISPVPRDVVSAAATRLAGRGLPPGRYVALAGFAGRAPLVAHGSERPFRLSTQLEDVSVTIRIDAWLPFDTMRRAGFGQVIVDGRHALTVERGLSLVALAPSGEILKTAYAGGLFAPQGRLLIPVLR
jgi:hypothetical protein